GDAASVTQTSGSYSSPNAGTSTVTVSLARTDFSANGLTDLGNYTLPSSASGSGTITPKALTLAPTVASKPYDGTTAATVSGYGLSGFVTGESVTASSTSAAFSSANVKTTAVIGGVATLIPNAVTISGITLVDVSGSSGGLASNYSVDASATVAANITPKTLTFNASAANKVYDATNTATVTGYGLGGLVSTETLAVSSTGAVFNSKNVAEANTVTISGISIADGLNGGLADNYTLPATSTTASASITPKALTIASSAADKVYNGTTSATATGHVLTGFIGSETVTASSTGATFNSQDVVSANTVTITGITLADGSNSGLASNYSVSASSTATAKITPKALSASASADNKVYDGTTAASITAYTLSGFVSGDESISAGSTSAAFATKDTGTGKTVSVSGVYLINGADGKLASNYSVGDTATALANITPKALTLAATAADKVYDGHTTASVSGYGLSGFVGLETVGASSSSAEFNYKDVLTASSVSISGIALNNGSNGGLASNYSVAASTTASARITPATLTLAATANNKAYDGTTTASVSSYGLTGIVSGEALGASSTSATFNNKDVLTANTVTISGITLSDAVSGLASNYKVDSSTTAAASITPYHLTLAATAADKVYDGTQTAFVTGYGLTGLFGVEKLVASSTGASFDSKNAAVGKTVSISGITIADGQNGGLASNYTVNASGVATASITPKPLTVSVSAADKVYDQSALAAISTST
ncbi:MAG: YDG domain-containing protein, partial [Verrucomicrobiota bacterium]